DAYAGLWRFLAAMDWVSTVKAERRHPAERLPGLGTSAGAALIWEVGDGLWVKLLDIPTALAARTYEREGSVVLEIVERDGVDGERRTRVLLEASGGGATCAETTRSPELTLDASALASAYLGGPR